MTTEKNRVVIFDYKNDDAIMSILTDKDIMSDIVVLPRNNRIVLYYSGKKLFDIVPYKNGFKLRDKGKKTIDSLDYFISDKTTVQVKNEIIKRKELIKNLKVSTPEKRIQMDIAKKYESNEEKIFIDMEYATAFDSKDDKNNNSNIKGRYDFIFLNKNVDNYSIVFIELKSLKSAYTDLTTGVINHMSDMQKYLIEYKENEDIRKGIKDVIKSVLEMRNAMGVKSININNINFDNTQFWLLFDMVEGEKIPETIDEIIKDELDKYNRSKSSKKSIPVFSYKNKGEIDINKIREIITNEKYRFFIKDFKEINFAKKVNN